MIDNGILKNRIRYICCFSCQREYDKDIPIYGIFLLLTKIFGFAGRRANRLHLVEKKIIFAGCLRMVRTGFPSGTASCACEAADSENSLRLADVVAPRDPEG